jgi:hypothetical protein
MAGFRRVKRYTDETLIVVSGKLTKSKYDEICEIAWKKRRPLSYFVEMGVMKILEEYGNSTKKIGG